MDFSKEDLLQYISNKKTAFDIAEAFKCSVQKVRYWIKKYGLEYDKVGFFRRPWLKIGTPKGTPKSDKWHKVMKDRMTGERNPFYNKKHSSATKQQMSENHADFTGDNNPFRRSVKDPTKRQQHKVRCKDIWNTRDSNYRKLFGEKISRYEALNPINKKEIHKKHKSGFINTIKGGLCFCRSSWEQNVCKLLDNNDTVISFSLEQITLEYKIDNKRRWCRIDFLITLANKKKILLEVKPLSLLYYDNNPHKIKTMKQFAKEHNYMFAILTRNDEILLDRILKVGFNYGIG